MHFFFDAAHYTGRGTLFRVPDLLLFGGLMIGGKGGTDEKQGVSGDQSWRSP